MEALAGQSPSTAEEEGHRLKIAKYRHFLDWLKYVLDCIHSARKTSVEKLESYHQGSLPTRLTRVILCV